MFSREDIVFDVNSILLNQFCQDKAIIINSIYSLGQNLIQKLGITSLRKITIKDINLLDGELGKVVFSFDRTGLVSEIFLSYTTAIRLEKVSQFYSETRFNDAYATFCHEFYHIYDREQLLKFSSVFQCTDPDATVFIATGLKIWTEFFAAYSTFEIFEQPHIYNDFSKAFSGWPLKAHTLSYNISRILGYYMHCNHDKRCDTLVSELSTRSVSSVTCLLSEMLEKYPAITADDLVNLKRQFDCLIPVCAI